MVKVVYEVVEHDGGWAYKFNGVFSETYPTREAAQGAGAAAPKRRRVAGRTGEHGGGGRPGQGGAEPRRGHPRPGPGGGEKEGAGNGRPPIATRLRAV